MEHVKMWARFTWTSELVLLLGSKYVGVVALRDGKMLALGRSLLECLLNNHGGILEMSFY